MFGTHGYAGTTVAAVAATAEVSVAAVELAFPTKPDLLKAAIDVAIVGDDEPVPVLERPWAASARAAPDATAFLDAVATILGAGRRAVGRAGARRPRRGSQR